MARPASMPWDWMDLITGIGSAAMCPKVVGGFAQGETASLNRRQSFVAAGL
jgi:hypothetical protein